MGLFKKIIDVFYDPVEGEETEEEKEIPRKEIKQEVKPEEKIRIEEVHIPKVEPKIVEESPVYSERDIFKTETAPKSFKWPVIDEEENKEKPMVRTTRSSIYTDDNIISPKKETKFERLENVKRDINKENRDNNIKTESKNDSGEKKFKLTPPISPIYGILDKNYKKEDITIRQDPIIHRNDDMNYDSVRRKAYGTLEDELENTLTKISKTNDEIEKTIEETDNFNIEENNKSIEDLLNEIEGNKSMSIGEIEEKMNDSTVEEENVPTFKNINLNEETEKMEKPSFEEDDNDDSFDKTLEHDLFNLIDSMYEEKEEE